MTRYVLPFVAAALLVACGDDSIVDPTPVQPVSGVLLKDVVVQHLPSPYYHFEYDASGRVKEASFASDLRKYDVTYTDGRITGLQDRDLTLQDRLTYLYDDEGRVFAVRYDRPNGELYTVIFYSYDGARLIKAERYRLVAPSVGFIIDKTQTLAYDASGNLSELTTHRPEIQGEQTEATYVDHFEQYDGGSNVEAFSLLHDEFSDHLVLLPGVKLQQGNPRRVTRTGDGVNYVADYTFVYDGANRPLSKTGSVQFTAGPEAGQTFQTLSQFSYY